MAVKLEGDCMVRKMREGIPTVSGTLAVWHQIGREIGAEAISLRILEFAPGLSPGILNEPESICDPGRHSPSIIQVLNRSCL